MGQRADDFNNGTLQLTLPSGQIDWGASCGCYRLQFKGKRVVEIVHRPTNESVVLSEAEYIDDTFALNENYKDWSAKVHKKPMQPQKLHVFFSSTRKGPYSFSQWRPTKCREYELALTSAKDRFDKAQALAAVPTSTAASSTTVDALQQMRSEKKEESLKKARADALNTMASKRAKRSYVLKGSSASVAT